MFEISDETIIVHSAGFVEQALGGIVMIINLILNNVTSRCVYVTSDNHFSNMCVHTHTKNIQTYKHYLLMSFIF